MLPQLSGSAAPSTQKAPHGMHAGPPLPRHRPRACPVRLRHVTPKPPCAHGCRDVRPDQPALTSRLVVPASSCAGKVGGGRGGPPLACPACYAGLISCQTNALRCPVVFPRPGGHYPGHHPPPGATCPAPRARQHPPGCWLPGHREPLKPEFSAPNPFNAVSNGFPGAAHATARRARWGARASRLRGGPASCAAGQRAGAGGLAGCAAG